MAAAVSLRRSLIFSFCFLTRVRSRGVERRGLQHGKHRRECVVSLRPACRRDRAIVTDDQGAQDEHRRDVVVHLVVGRVDRRVAEAHQGRSARRVEPDVDGVDRTVAQPCVVQLGELPQIASSMSSSTSSTATSFNVWSSRSATSSASPVSDIPTASEAGHRHTTLVGEEHGQRLVFHLLAAVGAVLRPLILVPGCPPQPRPPPGAPRVTAQAVDEQRSTVRRCASRARPSRPVARRRSAARRPTRPGRRGRP